MWDNGQGRQLSDARPTKLSARRQRIRHWRLRGPFNVQAPGAKQDDFLDDLELPEDARDLDAENVVDKRPRVTAAVVTELVLVREQLHQSNGDIVQAKLDAETSVDGDAKLLFALFLPCQAQPNPRLHLHDERDEAEQLQLV